MPPGHQPGPIEVADLGAGLVPAGDLEQPPEVLSLEAFIGVDDQAVGQVAQIVEQPAVEGRQSGPPDHDGQLRDQEGRHDA